MQRRNGVLFTLLLSSIMLLMAYGNLLRNINSVYFGASGDGLQSYYTAIFQIRYDSTYWRVSGMNHPYGENAFFTGNQPLLTAFIKLVSNTVYDISPWSLGVFNMAMLLGVLLCALSLFLIFNRLKLPWAYAAIASVGITFLAPQMQRLGAHYSLAYPFSIPLFILFLMRFNEKPDVQRSVSLAVLTFVMASFHLYFFGIFALMAGFYYLITWYKKQHPDKNWRFYLGHFSLQVIAPFLLVTLLINLNDEVTDRTRLPWGFLHYKSAWEGVFLPIGRPLGDFIHNHIVQIRHVEWEGLAFVGHVASLAFMVLLGLFFVTFARKKYSTLFNVSGNHVVNCMFWASIPALLYSFGLPFILNLEFLLDYLGIVKQMRGIARFSWIFYYTLNIVVFYLLYQMMRNKGKLLKWAGFILSLGILLYDGWFSVRSHDFYLNNRIPQLEGTSGEYELLVNSIAREKYQSIIPLPLFAIGSENIWIGGDESIKKETLCLSLRTGIPTNGSMLARTSISQAFRQYQLVQEPYRMPLIFEELKDPRPFLLLTRQELLDENEQRFVSGATKIGATDDFELYEISLEKLKELSVLPGEKVLAEITGGNVFTLKGFLASDSTGSFIHQDFDNLNQKVAYHSTASYQGTFEKAHKLYEGPALDLQPGDEFVISFWFKNYFKDLYARTSMEFAFVDTLNHVSKGEYAGMHQCIKVQDGEWALVEWTLTLPENCHMFQFHIWNHDLSSKAEFFLDNLLVRPKGLSLYKVDADYIFKNNRYYLRD